MTSSLVGSEMCIRDSVRYECQPIANNRTRTGATSNKYGRAWSLGTQNQTVSYTHLTLPTICSV
eukprot:3919364-Prorocentrum_lima.AAC.1